MVRGTSSSLTAAEKEAARSATGRASPFCWALWMRFSMAVFSPEKDMSRGASSMWTRGRGKAWSSPPWAARSRGAPPG